MPVNKTDMAAAAAASLPEHFDLVHLGLTMGVKRRHH